MPLKDLKQQIHLRKLIKPGFYYNIPKERYTHGSPLLGHEFMNLKINRNKTSIYPAFPEQNSWLTS